MTSAVSVLTIALCVSTSLGCASLQSPKTPQGVDVRPVVDFQLDTEPFDLAALQPLFPKNVIVRREPGHESLLSLSIDDRPPNWVKRDIFVSRYVTSEAASKSYLRSRELDSTEPSKLWKEGGREGNRFYLSYVPPRASKNHGIVVGVINNPEITFLNQKRNLLLGVSFLAYTEGDIDYVSRINADIAVLGRVLEKALGQAD